MLIGFRRYDSPGRQSEPLKLTSCHLLTSRKPLRFFSQCPNNEIQLSWSVQTRVVGGTIKIIVPSRKRLHLDLRSIFCLSVRTATTSPYHPNCTSFPFAILHSRIQKLTIREDFRAPIVFKSLLRYSLGIVIQVSFH